jgi:hypothetical protein
MKVRHIIWEAIVYNGHYICILAHTACHGRAVG